MRLFLILTMIINFSFAIDLETRINNFFLDWDAAHNNKDLGLYDKLYLEKVNYYNNKNLTKLQILEDKIRILKKYPDFKQTSIVTFKEEISDQIMKVNYKKDTFYNGKNRTYNSYLILNYKNEQIKIVEENDNKDKIENDNNLNKNNIKDVISNKEFPTDINNKKWEELISEHKDIWDKLSCTPSEAKRKLERYNYYKKSDFDKLGLTTSEAIKWLEAIGCRDEYGISFIGEKYLKAGITNPLEARKWEYLELREGFLTWYKKGFSPELIEEWRHEGIYTLEKVEELNAINISSPMEMKEWNNTKFIKSTSDIKGLKQINIHTPQEVIEWKETGFIRGIDDIKSLKGLNINTPQEAIKWKEIGAKKTSDILNLNFAGLKSVDEVLEWQKTKLDLSEIRQLIKINVTSEYVNNNPIIKSMLRTNMRDIFLSSKESLNKYVEFLTNNECKSIESISFDDADEYNNKGFCYFFSGVMTYRLDKNQGFISNKNGVFAHVNFFDSWPELKEGKGIIKGLGNYKYEDISGNIRFIRNGTVIVLERR